MLVSVVMPAYNAENWIKESLESVEAQTHPELEVIVVDDGSTDRTFEVATQAMENSKRPYRLLRQVNAGAAAARNAGWQAARGEWVQFLDADDLIEPEKISAQVVVAGRDGLADVVYSNWERMIFTGKGWKSFDRREPIIDRNNALADVLSDRNFLQLGSALFKRNMINRAGGFDKDHEPIEDVGLYVKIAVLGGVFAKAASSRPMARYRDLPRSFSKINHRRFIDSCIKNAKLAEQHLKFAPDGSSKVVDAIIDVYFMGARYFAENDWSRFNDIVEDIEALRPSFVPEAPWHLNVISKIVGYKKAERVAVLYRKSKRIGHSAFRFKKTRRPIA